MNQLRQTYRNKVFRTNLKPNWIHGDQAVWYRVQTGPGKSEFVCADLRTGKRSQVFDQVRLATKLSEMTGKQVNPDRLPFDTIYLDETLSSAFFKWDGKSFRVTRSSGELSEVERRDFPKESRGTTELRPSGPSETEIHVEFVNRRKESIRLYWIDTNGRSRDYGQIPSGGVVKQHTYAGHVWLLTDNRRKPLKVFTSSVEERKCVVDESSKTQIKFPSFGNRRGNQRGVFDRSNRVSKDGKWSIEIRNLNVFLKNRSTAKEIQLTTDGEENDFYTSQVFWSPDSAKVVVLREKPPQEHQVYMIESSPRNQTQPKLQSQNYLKPGDRIRQNRPTLFDVKAQKQVPVKDDLFANPWRLSDFFWKRDSSEFTFRYNQRGHQAMRLVGINADSGKARAIIDETTRTFIDYNYKFKVRYLRDSSEAIWSSERDGWNHLYLYDTKTGELKNQITKGKWLVRQIDRIDVEKRQIWFQAGGIIPNQDPYYVHYCRINFDGTGLVNLTRGDGTHSISYSPTGRYLLDRYSRVDMPDVHEIRDVEMGKLIVKLESGDDSNLRNAGWRTPERFVAPGRDGRTPIFGVIYRPTQFDPDKKYPVIEYIYAGPHGSFVPKRFATMHVAQELAELGFIVVQIDGMGTSNRSKAFHDVCWKNLGDSGFPDRIRWIKTAANQYRFMDLSRVGIFGGSAGGQSSTRALLAFGDFYHVAVSDCGCHDNRMDKIWWNEQWMGWPIGPHYKEQSNVTNAHKLKGKLFLIVGELDRNVDPASTLQVVDALVKANKDFDFLLVPGGGHGIGSRPYGKRRTYDFFVRHLHGVEPRSR